MRKYEFAATVFGFDKQGNEIPLLTLIGSRTEILEMFPEYLAMIQQYGFLGPSIPITARKAWQSEDNDYIHVHIA